MAGGVEGFNQIYRQSQLGLSLQSALDDLDDQIDPSLQEKVLNHFDRVRPPSFPPERPAPLSVCLRACVSVRLCASVTVPLSSLSPPASSGSLLPCFEWLPRLAGPPMYPACLPASSW